MTIHGYGGSDTTTRRSSEFLVLSCLGVICMCQWFESRSSSLVTRLSYCWISDMMTHVRIAVLWGLLGATAWSQAVYNRTPDWI